MLVNEGSIKCIESKGFSMSGFNEGLTTTLNMSNYIGIEDLEFDFKYVNPDITGDRDFIYKLHL